jgi:hypothetical protein
LYLVGSGTFPGAGIEAVVISALIADDILPRNAQLVAAEKVAQEASSMPLLTVSSRIERNE